MNTAKASTMSRELEQKALLERMILQSWTAVPMLSKSQICTYWDDCSEHLTWAYIAQ